MQRRFQLDDMRVHRRKTLDWLTIRWGRGKVGLVISESRSGSSEVVFSAGALE